MKIDLLDEQTAYAGFYRLRRLTLAHERYDGAMTPPLVREVVERSDVAAALLLDDARGRVVLVEQFRPGPYAAGQSPWLVDIVAGRIESGHAPEETIIREIREEVGVDGHEALARYGTPEIFNTDQGSQFTSAEFTDALKKHKIEISMDGWGRCHDNIFVERLWWTVKHEWVYLRPCDNGIEQQQSLAQCFDWYNRRRPHQSLGWQTPDETYFGVLAGDQPLAA